MEVGARTSASAPDSAHTTTPCAGPLEPRKRAVRCGHTGLDSRRGRTVRAQWLPQSDHQNVVLTMRLAASHSLRWGAEQQDAFGKLKERIIQIGLLYFIDYDRRLHLAVHASEDGR